MRVGQMGQGQDKWDKCPRDKGEAAWDRTGHTLKVCPDCPGNEWRKLT